MISFYIIALVTFALGAAGTAAFCVTYAFNQSLIGTFLSGKFMFLTGCGTIIGAVELSLLAVRFISRNSSIDPIIYGMWWAFVGVAALALGILAYGGFRWP